MKGSKLIYGVSDLILAVGSPMINGRDLSTEGNFVWSHAGNGSSRVSVGSGNG